MTDRPRLVGAMDAGAVEDPQPAGLERVVGPGRDQPPGERAGPGTKRHQPGGVYHLVLDVVEASRGLEPDLADGDRVAANQLQVAVGAEPEGCAVDRDERRVAPAEEGDGYPWPGMTDRDLDHTPRLPRDEGLDDLTAKAADRDCDAAVAGLHAQPVEARHDDGIRGRAADLPLQLLDDTLDRRAGVADVRLQVRLDLTAGQVAPRPREKPVATAESERPGNERLGVDRDLRLPGRKDERPTVGAEDERALERAVGTLELDAC